MVLCGGLRPSAKASVGGRCLRETEARRGHGQTQESSMRPRECKWRRPREQEFGREIEGRVWRQVMPASCHTERNKGRSEHVDESTGKRAVGVQAAGYRRRKPSKRKNSNLAVACKLRLCKMA